MRRAETEGKIKGPARTRPQSQSARGVGAARSPAASVPPKYENPQGITVARVLYSMQLAALPWSWSHGHKRH
jgi:hypothetical protein